MMAVDKLVVMETQEDYSDNDTSYVDHDYKEADNVGLNDKHITVVIIIVQAVLLQ